ncbi:putative F-box protein [Senna tora]|uniref:Putative F-box protein n=1 Tax=Senna tora TaxID=362788 RepID=A0A834SV42_9FABA|nr:putative F-box protein [Senna tora]
MAIQPRDDRWEAILEELLYEIAQQTKDTLFRGSCYGWLITVGLDDSIRMLNPVTRAQIYLPPMSTLPTVISYQPESHDHEYKLRERNDQIYTFEKWYMQRAIFRKFVLSCPPDDENQDFMAVAIVIIESHLSLCYCRRGDKKWTQLTRLTNLYFEDVIFHEGKINVVDGNCFIYEFDMKTTLGGLSRRPSFDNNVRKNHADDHRYLVQSSDGLLLVVKHGKWVQGEEGDTENEKLRTYNFSVFKLNECQNKWSVMKSLNNYVLMLGYNSSICVMPHAIPRDKGNCIYYSDDWLELQYGQIEGVGYDNGVFDFEDGAVHPFFRDTDLICPAPIWLL